MVLWGGACARTRDIGECSELDDIIVIRRDGKALVSRIAQ